MKWNSYHHPDLSLPVIRRRASEQWIDLLLDVGEMLATNGRSLTWNKTYPNLRAYHNAMSRLRKAGLIVRSDLTGKLPCLRLTDQGRSCLPDYYHPNKLWNTRWNGIWYTLIFDVPERERYYRDTLRRFIKRLHMGCLQKSVWITPRDIRPIYDDLNKAANVDAVAYLLESKTVLRRETNELVLKAWDFDWLNELQARYLSVYNNNLSILKGHKHDEEALLNLLYQESEAFIQCMRLDPLLPNELLPNEYLGKKVFGLHKKVRTAIAKNL